jgi:hypothetical protein
VGPGRTMRACMEVLCSDARSIGETEVSLANQTNPPCTLTLMAPRQARGRCERGNKGRHLHSRCPRIAHGLMRCAAQEGNAGWRMLTRNSHIQTRKISMIVRRTKITVEPIIANASNFLLGSKRAVRTKPNLHAQKQKP